MASIKVKFRPSANSPESGHVFFQVIHQRVVRQVSTSITISNAQWTTVWPTDVAAAIRADELRLRRIVKQLERYAAEYTADDIVTRFRLLKTENTLFRFMQKCINRLRTMGRLRTSETYIAALNSIARFRDGKDVILDEIDSEMMEAYQQWLYAGGLCPNTVSFYMRILRAVYNRAVEQGLIETCRPFTHVYTGIDKTKRRAISLSYIRRIRDLNLSQTPVLDLARDIFLFSFYCRGMSFVDMAYLRKSDLSNGILSYRRRKTNQRLVIKWEREMQRIVDKYPVNVTPYLLPIIRSTERTERAQYRQCHYQINMALKIVGAMVGLSIPLTTYVARHSWASVARAKNIPVSVISEGMGHDSDLTTQIYLASLDTAVVDRANSMILRALG